MHNGILKARGRRREENDPDRFLQRRGDRFHYYRRVPKELRDLDGRGAFVRRALDTTDQLKARTSRDLHEAADNALCLLLCWAKTQTLREFASSALSSAKRHQCSSIGPSQTSSSPSRWTP
ncbi:DUF6538 domain-containing protein [Mesorhizobium sp.]|uniref:DUF6538 domain-containing protein n=1 Tax=Mesorhizobium sp. TaxID=1871066 RepID=UPI00345D8C53